MAIPYYQLANTSLTTRCVDTSATSYYTTVSTNCASELWLNAPFTSYTDRDPGSGDSMTQRGRSWATKYPLGGMSIDQNTGALIYQTWHGGNSNSCINKCLTYCNYLPSAADIVLPGRGIWTEDPQNVRAVGRSGGYIAPPVSGHKYTACKEVLDYCGCKISWFSGYHDYMLEGDMMYIQDSQWVNRHAVSWKNGLSYGGTATSNWSLDCCWAFIRCATTYDSTMSHRVRTQFGARGAGVNSIVHGIQTVGNCDNQYGPYGFDSAWLIEGKTKLWNNQNSIATWSILRPANQRCQAQVVQLDYYNMTPEDYMEHYVNCFASARCSTAVTQTCGGFLCACTGYSPLRKSQYYFHIPADNNAATNGHCAISACVFNADMPCWGCLICSSDNIGMTCNVPFHVPSIMVGGNEKNLDDHYYVAAAKPLSILKSKFNVVDGCQTFNWNNPSTGCYANAWIMEIAPPDDLDSDTCVECWHPKATRFWPLGRMHLDILDTISFTFQAVCRTDTGLLYTKPTTSQWTNVPRIPQQNNEFGYYAVGICLCNGCDCRIKYYTVGTGSQSRPFDMHYTNRDTWVVATTGSNPFSEGIWLSACCYGIVCTTNQNSGWASQPYENVILAEYDADTMQALGAIQYEVQAPRYIRDLNFGSSGNIAAGDRATPWWSFSHGTLAFSGTFCTYNGNNVYSAMANGWISGWSLAYDEVDDSVYLGIDTVDWWQSISNYGNMPSSCINICNAANCAYHRHSSIGGTIISRVPSDIGSMCTYLQNNASNISNLVNPSMYECCTSCVGYQWACCTGLFRSAEAPILIGETGAAAFLYCQAYCYDCCGVTTVNNTAGAATAGKQATHVVKMAAVPTAAVGFSVSCYDLDCNGTDRMACYFGDTSPSYCLTGECCYYDLSNGWVDTCATCSVVSCHSFIHGPLLGGWGCCNAHCIVNCGAAGLNTNRVQNSCDLIAFKQPGRWTYSNGECSGLSKQSGENLTFYHNFTVGTGI